MYRVLKIVEISAGHYLTELPAAHPCRHPHGHNYKIEVVLQSASLDAAGMILDFDVISQIVKRYDHKGMLNDLFPFSPERSPTAENFAKALMDLLRQELQALGKDDDRVVEIVRVRVWETDTAWAEVF